MLVKIFAEQVQKNPGQLAVKTAESSLTYSELDRMANQVANEMVSIASGATHSGSPDTHQKNTQVVGLLFEHGTEMIVGLVSAIKAGYIYVPLDPNYPENRLSYMLENAGAKLIVTNSQNEVLAKRLTANLERQVEILNVSTISADAPAEPVERPLLTREVAYILYTSGSTGMPKGVVQTHENIWHFIRNYIKDYRLNANDRLTLFSAFSHDAAVMDIYSGLLSGATLYPLNLKKQVNLAELADWLRREKITIYHSVPTVYRYFTKTLTGHEKFPDLKFIILGGEGVLEHDVNTFMRLFESPTTLVNLYGQSESSYNSAQFIQKGRPFEKITLGQTVEDCDIWVVNDEHEEVDDLEIGEIVVVCNHIALGYWQDPERTEQVFSESPTVGRIYWTGDLGRRLLDGTVEFIGRKDFQVKVRGYRVDLNEIESRLLSHPAVDEAVVLAKDDPDGNKFLVAYVVATEPIAEGRLKAFLGNNLPDYMVPGYFVYLDKLPVTPTNKIDRNALPEPVRGSGQGDYVAPRNEIEEIIAAIWAEVLRLEVSQVGVQTSFFELGGNSLSVMNLATLLSRRFGKTFRIPDLFRQRTVAEMAKLLEAMTGQATTEDEIQRLPNRDWYPVSAAQQRMFILQQFDEQSTAYNLPMVLQITGRLDFQRFNSAVEKLIARHETLRTSFQVIDGEVQQKVHRNVECPVEKYALEANASREEVEKIIREFIRPFDLSQPPLFRIGLLEQGEEQILLFDIYHIISDGFSNEILISDFWWLYTGETLSPLQIQYRDFAYWQNQILASAIGKAEEDYWLSKFAPERTGREIPVLNLPTDYERPAQQSFEGARVNFTVTSELANKLNSLAKSTETTLFMVLLAAYKLLLAKYSGQEEIIVGSPVAGRSRPELNELIGMFVNTLALRSFPTGAKPFLNFLEEVKEETLEALENQEYPFEALVSQLKLKRDTGRNPLFDVGFRLQNYQRNEIEFQDITVRAFGYDNPVVQFDLQLTCIEYGGEIVCSFEYATNLFARATIHAMVEHYLQLLQGVVTAPEKRLSELTLLTEAEQKRLIKWNATTTEYPRQLAVHQLFEAQVERTPDAVALVARSIRNPGEVVTQPEHSRLRADIGLAPAHAERLTYRQLNVKANQLARQLRAQGVGRDTVVGIMVERSVEMLIGMLAVMKAGGAYLPIDPEYPAERVLYVLSDSCAKLLLTQCALSEQINFTGETLYLENPDLYSGDGSNLTNVNEPEDLIYLIYTSGSTGRPKGTMLKHHNVHNFIVSMQGLVDYTVGKVLASLTTVSFDIFVLETLFPLTSGMRVVLTSEIEQLDPQLFHELMHREEVEMIQFTPSRLQIFLDSPGAAEVFARVKEFIVGGEAFPEHLLERLRAISHAKIYNMYGPTETAVYSTVAELTQASQVTIGRPIANTRIYLLDQYREMVPARVTGEVYIAGEGVARGYHNRPELTAERFFQDPFYPGERMYRTGDLARWLPDGQIDYIGRIDAQVKIRGYRIEVGEIESLLNTYPGIKENVVIAKDGPDGFKYLLSYYVALEDIVVSDLRHYLLQNLPEYMVPGVYQRLEAIPLTPNGKIDRKALPEPDSYRPHLTTKFQAAETETQKTIARLWSEVLRIERIGINDNFFDLGGNSLLAMNLATRLSREFDCKIRITDLFSHQTVEEMAHFLETMATSDKPAVSNAADALVLENVSSPEAVQPKTIAQNTAPERAHYYDIPILPQKEWYPVSSAQRRMYILRQLEGQNIAYNLPIVMQIDGKLDRARFTRAFAQLIQRHEALRTSFHMVDGELMQRVQPTAECPIETYTLAKTAPRSEVEALIGWFIRPFDLAQAPLFRVGVIQWGDVQILIFDIHHIIADGTSQEIIITEFLRLYVGEILPPLKIQYRDFASWQNQVLASDMGQARVQYWLGKFAPELTGREIPVLNLPLDYPRPAKQSFDGARHRFTVTPELTAKLRTLVKNSGATLFMVLMAAYNLLLAKYSGQEDIIVGTPVAGRIQPELNGIIGMFVNTLAIRSFPEGQKTFLHFLKEIKEETFQALEYQDYQFEELVNRLNLRRDTGRNPLFDASFRLQNYPRGEMVVNDIVTRPFAFENSISQFDLQLTCIEFEGGIACKIEYAIKLFAHSTIERMVGHLMQLLHAIVSTPEKTLSELSMLREEEQAEMLAFNATDTDYPRALTVHQLFEAQAERTPDAIALVAQSLCQHLEEINLTQVAASAEMDCLEQAEFVEIASGDASSVKSQSDAAILTAGTRLAEVGLTMCKLTYRELNQRANHLARHLRARGVGRETVVGLMVGRSAELLIGMLALLKAGGAYLPIDPEYPAERIQYVLSDSEARLLLTQRSLATKVEFAGEMIFLDNAELYETAHDSKANLAEADSNLKNQTGMSNYANLTNINQSSDLAYLIYTSGSTGRPKGTMLEHRSVHNFIVGMQQVIDFKPGKVIGSLTTASFDIFVLETLLPLSIGMRIVLAPEVAQLDGQIFRELMQGEGVEMLQLTPSRLQIFLQDTQAVPVLAGMREILVGGEAFPEHLLGELRKVSEARIYNMYGPTETTVWSTVKELTSAEQITIGRPIANTRVYILDQYLHMVPTRVTGELYIAGEGLARGYFKRPDLTAERFIPDPFKAGEMMYRTGDLARWLGDGQIEYVGRSDQQVKIRGYRIEVGEIESLLSEYPGIKENVVVAKDGTDGFKYLVCYYVAPEELSVTDLRAYLMLNLPDYMVPGVYQCLEALPLTPNGKIDQKALPDPEGYRPHLTIEYQEAETSIQKQIVLVWSELLKIEKIGINDNFFDLGGTSLLLIQLQQKIEAIYPGQVTTVDLFAYPTVARLASFIESKVSANTRNQEIEAYWNQELGDLINLLTLPAGYYETDDAEGESYNLQFRLSDAFYQPLQRITEDNGVDLTDIATAMYIYLLKEISGTMEVLIEACVKDDPTMVFPLKINFEGMSNLVDLFKMIHEKYDAAKSWYTNLLPGRLRKTRTASKFIPLFTIHPTTARMDNELALVVQNVDSALTLICEYNGSKLNGEQVEEFFTNYLTLLEMVAREYQG